MIEVGRVCVKIAGREADKPCVIVEKIDDNFVLIDGLVRRKKCNIKHLEFTTKIVKVSKSSSSQDVLNELVGLGLLSKEEADKFGKKEKKEKKSEKPVKQRIVKKEEVKEKKEKKESKPKKAVKKED